MAGSLIWNPPFFLGADDQVQDLLGEGDDDAASQRQKTLRALAGVMALEGEAHLHDAPAQQDEAHSADDGEDKGVQIVHHLQRVAGLGKGRHGKTAHPQHQRHENGKRSATLPSQLCGVYVLFFLGRWFFQKIQMIASICFAPDRKSAMSSRM